MAYVNAERRSDLNVKQDDLLASKRFVLERKPDSAFFYELEEAVVLDVVMDENHPLKKCIHGIVDLKVKLRKQIMDLI